MSEISATAAMRITIAVFAWFALLLQLYLMVALMVANSPANGWAVVGVIVNYFSFFTILTNLLVAVALTFSVALPESFWGRFFSSAAAQAGTAVYIAVVGLTYSLLLRHLWNPVGAQKVADVLLHDVVPVTYVIYWLIFAPKAKLRWKDALLWLIYPIVYMLYTLIHGIGTGWWSYPFIDAHVLGFPRALGNGGLVLLGFFGIGLVAIAIGRWAGRRSARYQS